MHLKVWYQCILMGYFKKRRTHINDVIAYSYSLPLYQKMIRFHHVVSDLLRGQFKKEDIDEQ